MMAEHTSFDLEYESVLVSPGFHVASLLIKNRDHEWKAIEQQTLPLDEDHVITTPQ